MEQVRKFQIDWLNDMWDIVQRKTGSPAAKNQLWLLYAYKNYFVKYHWGGDLYQW